MKMKFLLHNVTNFLLVLILFICVLCLDSAGAVPDKHGYFAQKLDEYFSTIKCMANIMEDLMPEMNSLMACCGVWIMHDWLGSMVLESCYDHNYHQINNLTQPLIIHMEEKCSDYPRNSYSCKMMIITPITFLIIFLVLMICLCICASVTCIRLKRYQRYHEYHKSQGLDSCGTDETTDDPTAPAPPVEKKMPIDV